MNDNKTLNTIALVLLIISEILPSPIREIVRCCVMIFLIYITAMHYEGKKRILVAVIMISALILITVW